ncbi:gamma-glutamylcyclotransferase family protein [Novosphingobium rosa]|uniref:gamma-glutamylcyclotransferase family protein n=1 Tax=Novosphingobium rosa TaxID=76978 RepID=UPI00082A929C|nr:gamma-glutamylcyclotransferase family protein [Novosphingobium rosa]
MIPPAFFFYGTLMAGMSQPLARVWHAGLSAGEAGWARGALWAIPDPEGWYPALLPGEGRVLGMVYRPLAGFDAAMLAAMDRYEGDDYRRLALPVVLAEGEVLAQAYVWQGALPAGAVALEDGDFAAFLARRGEVPYRGG